MFVRSSDEEFAIRTFFGLPLLVTRCAVPSNGVGDFEWGRWRLARFSDVVRINRAFGSLKKVATDA